jgi:hypothetical protein
MKLLFPLLGHSLLTVAPLATRGGGIQRELSARRAVLVPGFRKGAQGFDSQGKSALSFDEAALISVRYQKHIRTNGDG